MMVGQPVFLNLLLFVGTNKTYMKNVFGFYVTLTRSRNKVKLTFITFINRKKLVKQQSKLIIQSKKENPILIVLDSLQFGPVII